MCVYFCFFRTVFQCRIANPLRRPLSVVGSPLARFHATPQHDDKILISDPADPICAETLRKGGHEVTELGKSTISEDELAEMIGDYHGLVVRSGTKVTKKIIDAGENLKLIGRAGTGVDNVSIPDATRKGILVMNTPGGNTNSAAELTICHLMALSRHIPQACSSLKEGRWDRKLYTGNELQGKKIGIIGLGRIGRQVAEWCSAIGMQVIGYDPLMSKEAAEKVGIEAVSLNEIYKNSDYISLHVPKNRETANLIGEKALNECKKGVRIINCSRGGIIDEQALLKALESGKVAGAGLDVFESEPPPESSKALLAHPNVICTPHLGASTNEAQVNVARDIANQFIDALAQRRFVGVVNAPARMDLASRRDLLPYISLAERLGSLQAQFRDIGQVSVKKVELILRGDKLADTAVADVIKTAALKGLLSQIVTEGSVNMINTPMYAEKLGIDVQVRTEPKAGNYNNLMTVNLYTEDNSGSSSQDKHYSMSATVFSEQESRLVQIDDYKVDIDPVGDILFFRNRDQPGVLQSITNVLSQDGVNIANFGLGRHGLGGDALGVLSLDSPIPEETLKRVTELDSVLHAWQANLPVTSRMRVSDKSGETSDSVPSAVHAGMARKPAVRPASPNFGSGPTKKRPGWKISSLADAPVGRSHRSKDGKGRLKYAIDFTHDILQVPEGYRVGIVPASDTGAFEMAMWSMLGERPVDVAHWESFGTGWYSDATKELKLENVRQFSADYGHLPNMNEIDSDHDVLFPWNGTTSGVRVPNADFIKEDRKGLTFCDATSAVFAQDVELEKCDVLTYSWQKALGGEAAHGMMLLSPRAVERLETFEPPRPLPKIFRMTKKGKINEDLFKGSTINTPSMLCVEDYIDALTWANQQGGLDALIKKANDNLSTVEQFVEDNNWIHFLPQEKSIRSNTSVCLTVDLEEKQVKKMVSLLEKEGVAYDVGSYRDAPAGIRIWCGSTVEKSDLEALMPWIKWAYMVCANE